MTVLRGGCHHTGSGVPETVEVVRKIAVGHWYGRWSIWGHYKAMKGPLIVPLPVRMRAHLICVWSMG